MAALICATSELGSARTAYRGPRVLERDREFISVRCDHRAVDVQIE
jgi:hypothetical protein